jgi:hypothetical protein
MKLIALTIDRSDAIALGHRPRVASFTVQGIPVLVTPECPPGTVLLLISNPNVEAS